MPHDFASSNQTIEFFLAAFEVVRVLFVMAFGACLGSLVNVLVYRMPLGLGVVTPASRCPGCETLLTWQENIPIVGWLMLRGRCRFCRTPISPEYPIVEAFLALLFGATYVLLYADGGTFLGAWLRGWQPEWGLSGFAATWPVFVAVLVLWTCLTAATLIDARTFHIPMSLTTVPVCVAVIAHPLAVWLLPMTNNRGLRVADGWTWLVASPGAASWGWVGAAIGGIAGIALSWGLLAGGLIKRSFADFDHWAQAHIKEHEGRRSDSPEPGSPGLGEESPEGPDLWTKYPHARREMLRELFYLAPAIGLGFLGAAVGVHLAGPWSFDIVSGAHLPATPVPLWLDALCGCLMGYLVGGGVVWLWRILGSLGVGKEALGMGDVHLMAAVGACLGWIDAVLGFFAAAFVGVFWTLLTKLTSGRLDRAMPFGPYLAIGTVLVWFCKPLIERLLGVILRAEYPISLP